jgi:hypothetical protein
LFSFRYPKASDYLIITKAVLRSLDIPVDNKNALVSFENTVLYDMQGFEGLFFGILW